MSGSTALKPMSGEITRNPDGTFPKGVSGNPAGRPKSRKNKITELKQDLEIAIRDNVNPQDIQDIVNAMIQTAKAGGKNSVQAAKLILDKTVSNATDSEDAKNVDGGIRIVIENVTSVKPTETIEAEDGDYTEVTE